LFLKLFSKELLLSRCRLYFYGCLASNSKTYYKSKPSVTKYCKTKQAEVQIPSSSTKNS